MFESFRAHLRQSPPRHADGRPAELCPEPGLTHEPKRCRVRNAELRHSGGLGFSQSKLDFKLTAHWDSNVLHYLAVPNTSLRAGLTLQSDV